MSQNYTFLMEKKLINNNKISSMRISLEKMNIFTKKILTL